MRFVWLNLFFLLLKVARVCPMHIKTHSVCALVVLSLASVFLKLQTSLTTPVDFTARGFWSEALNVKLQMLDRFVCQLVVWRD